MYTVPSWIWQTHTVTPRLHFRHSQIINSCQTKRFSFVLDFSDEFADASDQMGEIVLTIIFQYI